MKLYVCVFVLCALVAATATQSLDAAAPSAEYLPPVAEIDAAPLAQDGYRYKTVRKLRLRHRREAPLQEYLPPIQSSPSAEYLPPPQTNLADDGYRYKTVRKLRFRARHRRDVSEIAQPLNEYLPPVQVGLAPELSDVVGADGYRYKTVRRLKFRRHRREAVAAAVADEPAAEYLPPADAEAESAADEIAAAEPQGAQLAQDGYRYKTVRRLRYRYRY